MYYYTLQEDGLRVCPLRLPLKDDLLTNNSSQTSKNYKSGHTQESSVFGDWYYLVLGKN